MTSAENFLHRVRQHQAGLLLDTNLLLLFLAHEADPTFAMQWKQTDHFTTIHAQLLRQAVRAAHRLVTTPHILTEATNLATGGRASDAKHGRLKSLLREFAANTAERYVPSKTVAGDESFSRLGLADLALAFLPRRKRPLVLTVDAPLLNELENRNLPVANLNHYVFPVEGLV